MVQWQKISINYLDMIMQCIQVLLLTFLTDFAFVSSSQYQIQRQNSISLARLPTQHNAEALKSEEENNKAEATVFDEIQSFGGFGEEDNGGSADHHYFMYQHVPKKDHYDFGYKRGNDHHYQERHEKAHPHHGQFHTKVKWGDKHGGHGEHYWDYNHHGHHHGNDEEGRDDVGDNTEVNEDVERVDDELKMNEDIGKNLVFNVETGIVMDRITGRKFRLQPVYS
ncbi:uncharacterized protein [Rhodnius prolixus]|uniref:uncharacterized protein n=1 Tax=Rhodnius prolixus TaxID=13249 RepID=UPI003D18937E